MNEHDTEKMSGLLEQSGYSAAATVDEADIYLLNTCTIREKAEEKIYSRLGVLKKQNERANKDMIIGVAGCVAQQSGADIFKRSPQVDLVLGTQSLMKLPQMIESIEERQGRQCEVGKDPDNHLFPHEVPVRQSSLRGRITIMEGCNNYCTYCIVPFTRGRERSRPWEDIVTEAKMLAEKGYKEIELLGQNVNSYYSTVNFASLLRELNKVDGIEVVRYVSPHPKDFDQDVIDTIASCDRIATNIHLPAQSGNSRILKRMGREHTRENYLDKVKMIKDTIGHLDVSLTSDFIVGFPGETDAEFRETVQLLDDVGYDGIFSFMYSPRPGTGAIKHGDPIPQEVKKERLHILQKRQAEVQAELMRARVGKKVKVLVDKLKPGDKLPVAGRLRNNLLVHMDAGEHQLENLYGKQIDVEIVDAGLNSLRGRIL